MEPKPSEGSGPSYIRDLWDLDVDSSMLTLSGGKHGLYSPDGPTDAQLDDCYDKDMGPLQAARALLLLRKEEGDGKT